MQPVWRQMWPQCYISAYAQQYQMIELRVNKKGDHSLAPDMINGWRPSLTHSRFKQLPLHFSSPEADALSKSLTSFGSVQPYRIVYMGPRHTSNYKAFKQYAKKQGCNRDGRDEAESYGQLFQQYTFEYMDEKQKSFHIRALEYRVFTGMNPTIKKTDLRFQSCFECGNLDLAILVSESEYDLLMRVDSNTKGHNTWFYFKVSNFSHKQTVRFNIINFQKNGLLYDQGMKPYCFRSSSKSWYQAGTDVEFKLKKYRYCSPNDDNPILRKCLSFTYEFSQQDKYVYFAYCIPYSYSYLLHQLSILQKENADFFFVNYKHHSTGGLAIPIVTITSPSTIVEKQTCLAIGRLHPGQTQGSWMMEGFLKFLSSPKAFYLREKFVFKIIPMVNVDGVVLGNFRTSISGRDLNRYFHQPEAYEQVALVRQVAEKANALVFLDFHGHSTKRNVFMYGPNYKVDHKDYLTCRLFPKIISKLTPAFRYYSCIFKISHCKMNASRSIMIRQLKVAFAYTIEASSHSFGSKNEERLFSAEGYRAAGNHIAEGLVKFMVVALKMPKRMQQDKVKPDPEKRGMRSKEKPVKQQEKVKNISNLLQLDRSVLELFSEEKQLLEELLNDQHLKDKFDEIAQGEASQSDSDFEEGCDYTDEELKSIINPRSPSKQHSKHKSPSKHKTSKKKKISTPHLSALSLSPSQPSPTQQQSKQASKKMSPPRSLHSKKQKANNLQQVSNPTLPTIISAIDKDNDFVDVAQSGIEEGDSLNKVHYMNWRNLSSHDQSLSFEKVKSVNHINLSYSELEKKSEVEEEQMGLRQKQRGHFGRKLKNSILLREKGREKKQEGEKSLSIKKFLLPILNKKSLNQRQAQISFLQELLDHNSREYDNRAKRNLKILHF